jgi:prepilin-type N-terminal cleavage/methylation domain-containing protein
MRHHTEIEKRRQYMHLNRETHNQAGFSLIELLIAMSVMTIVTGAAFALVGSSLQFSSATYSMVDSEQGLRNSHEIINRDLVTAGDGLRGIGTIQVPKVFVQNYLTQTPVVDVNSPNYVNLALVISDDNLAGTTAVPQSSPAATVLGGTDRLTMLTQDTTFAPVTVLAGKITTATPNTNIVVSAADIVKFQTGEIYAIESQNSAAFGVISSINTNTNTLTLTNGDVYGINQTGPGTPINMVTTGGAANSAIIRLQIIQYYVNSNNLLMRRLFGGRGSALIDSVVAEHVTGLQFRYLLDLKDPNGFVPQPGRQLATSQQQLAVRQIETTVAVETARAVTNNGKQTISATTATTVRNLQFRQAL